MFKSFLTITCRSIFRQGVFSIINILGLSIGIAVVILISMFTFYELSFDKSFKEGKNIYRINASTDNDTYTSAALSLGPALHEIPEVIATVRTFKAGYDMSHNENPVGSRWVIWADSAFFQLFDTHFILGSPEKVMSQPNAIAISARSARTLFRDNDPLGQMLTITNYPGRNPPSLEVVAVFEDYPENSSLSEFRAIAPFMYSFEFSPNRPQTWIRGDFETFCLLTANADIKSVDAKIQKVVSDATVDIQGIDWRPQLQRFTDIHLHSKKYAGATTLSNMGEIEKIQMMSLLSVIILIVACVNYMNLSTARAQKRSREIGISKTVGAQRIELILRLMFETAFFTCISFVLAFIFARVFLPLFNNLNGVQLNFNVALNPSFLCIALLIWVVTTLLAASYPAIYISGFQPLTAIRNQSMPGSSHAMVRKVLIVGQFAVAIVLIAWVLIVRSQVAFINNKDLGYNYHNVISFWVHEDNPEALIDELKSLSLVEMISRDYISTISGNANTLFRDPEDQTGMRLKVVLAAPNYIDLMQMKLIAGTTYPEIRVDQLLFRDTIVGDRAYRMLDEGNITEIVLNRAAVDYLGLTPEEAIGKNVIAQIDYVLSRRNVIVKGVIENFHFESLHRPIGGYCVHYGISNPKRHLVLRVHKGNLSEQLKTLEEIYKKYYPNNPFWPVITEDEVAKFYEGERRTSQIAVVFSILAIFVACMGVFGLTAFMAEQRTKEIGIRKVMGASVWNIVCLFAIDYLKLLGSSLVIAIPAAWWIGERYLQDFAYRISLSWWIFAAAALITVALTLFTVCMLAIKAAMANPVNSISAE